MRRPALRVPRPFRIAAAILAAIAVAVLIYWRVHLYGVVRTDDARLQAELIDVAPTASGRLVDVRVKEGNRVSRADTLFTIDPRDFRLRVEQAERALGAARSDLDGARARLLRDENGPLPEEIDAAAADVAKQEAQVKLAEAEHARLVNLAGTGSTSEQDLDQSATALELDRRSLAEARARLAILKQGTRPEDLEADRATVDAAAARTELADAALRQANLALDESSVLAPVDGVVVRRWRDPGSNAGPSAPVVTLFNPASLYLEANIDEKKLAKVRPGQRVDFRLDAYPGHRFRGEVEAILRATQSSFSLIPSEGVSGTFIKVTQRVPVRIRVFDADPQGEGPVLLPGLSAEIAIHIRGGAAVADSDPDRR